MNKTIIKAIRWFFDYKLNGQQAIEFMNVADANVLAAIVSEFERR